MWILAYFTHNGEPCSGLSPAVRIRDVETGLVVVDGSSMVEKGDGFYGYDFGSYNPMRDYAIICDSVTLSGSERYTYASSGEYNEVLDSIESTVGTVDIRTNLLRKIQTNRLELFDGDSDNWILYDDDTITPLLTFSVSDKTGDIIVQQPHMPSKRDGATGTVVTGTLSPNIYMRKSVYDPDDDGIVSLSEGVSDGTFTSTASGIFSAVINTHSPYTLGTKQIDESTIDHNHYIKYNVLTNRLEYGMPGVSGTYDHGSLAGLLNDDHTQYLNEARHDITLRHGSSVVDHGSIGGLADDDHTQYHNNTRGDARYYQKSEVNTISGALNSKIITDHGNLTGLSDDDHTQYVRVDGSRGFTATVSGVTPTQSYHLATKGYIDEITELSAVQIRRTTDITVETSYANVTFGTTDFENNSDVLEHSSVNTDRILVKASGDYKIVYSLNPQSATATVTTNARVRINDTTVIPGSESSIRTYQDEIHELTGDFVVSLAAGSYLSLQVSRGTESTVTALSDTLMYVIKLDGVKGDKGDTGSGSNIYVQDGGVNIDGSPTDTINFVGFNIDDSVSGKASVSPPTFGSFYAYNSSTGASTTISTAFQQKVRLSMTIPATGTYRIGWRSNNKTTSATAQTGIQVQIDDTTTIETIYLGRLSSTTHTLGFAGFWVGTLTAGSRYIDLDFRSNGAATHTITNAFLECWRVS